MVEDARAQRRQEWDTTTYRGTVTNTVTLSISIEPSMRMQESKPRLEDLQNVYRSVSMSGWSPFNNYMSIATEYHAGSMQHRVNLEQRRLKLINQSQDILIT